MAGERIGVFGGMFNPPHHGHMICAQEARQQLDLDRVLLMPAGDPPHRDVDLDDLPTRDLRLRMAELAVRVQPGIEVSTLELDRDGPSYSGDTLAELAQQHPEAELTLIIGADQALTFGQWRSPQQIARLAEVAIATRTGADWTAATAEVERAGGRAPLGFEMPRIDISSTLVRAHVRQGRSVAHLVPAGVGELIEQQGLYR